MTCILHPHTDADGTCEYCAHPYCAACLRVMLGRRYCPDCLERVNGIASGATRGSTRGAASAPRVGAQTGNAVAAGQSVHRAGPALPGWVSAFLYLIGFYILEFVAGVGVTIMLGLAQAIRNPGAIPQLREGIGITDASAVGMPAWVLIFAFFGWGTLLTVLAYTALMTHAVERRRLTELGLNWTRTVLRDLPLGLALAAVLFISSVGVGISLGWYQVGALPTWPQGLLTAGLGFLILLPFAAVEEISIRGYLLHAATRSWGPRAGLLLSALVFAALHALNPHVEEHPLALLGILLAGLYLGLIVRVTGNLWLAIFLHTGWNLMEGPIFGLPISGHEPPASVFRTTTSGPAFWTGGAFGPEAGAFLCFLLAVHLAALWSIRPFLRTHLPEVASGPNPSEPVEPQSYRAIPLS